MTNELSDHIINEDKYPFLKNVKGTGYIKLVKFFLEENIGFLIGNKYFPLADKNIDKDLDRVIIVPEKKNYDGINIDIKDMTENYFKEDIVKAVEDNLLKYTLFEVRVPILSENFSFIISNNNIDKIFDYTKEALRIKDDMVSLYTKVIYNDEIINKYKHLQQNIIQVGRRNPLLEKLDNLICKYLVK